MKKIFLLLLILVGTATAAFSQTANANFLGYWKSDGTSVRLVIYTNDFGAYKIMAWDSGDGEVLEVSDLNIEGNTIRCTMYTKSTNWRIESVYTLMDRNTLNEQITNQEGKEIVVTYLRTK